MVNVEVTWVCPYILPKYWISFDANASTVHDLTLCSGSPSDVSGLQVNNKSLTHACTTTLLYVLNGSLYWVPSYSPLTVNDPARAILLGVVSFRCNPWSSAAKPRRMNPVSYRRRHGPSSSSCSHSQNPLWTKWCELHECMLRWVTMREISTLHCSRRCWRIPTTVEVVCKSVSVLVHLKEHCVPSHRLTTSSWRWVLILHNRSRWELD